ncbi:MAG: hypothetical protein K9M99_08345 [Candidatus Cloacimonetes bacterium]|nr:hypothetical protein [Candidatus Cloacimonadota bacterium]
MNSIKTWILVILVMIIARGLCGDYGSEKFIYRGGKRNVEFSITKLDDSKVFKGSVYSLLIKNFEFFHREGLKHFEYNEQVGKNDTSLFLVYSTIKDVFNSPIEHINLSDGDMPLKEIIEINLRDNCPDIEKYRLDIVNSNLLSAIGGRKSNFVILITKNDHDYNDFKFTNGVRNIDTIYSNTSLEIKSPAEPHQVNEFAGDGGVNSLMDMVISRNKEISVMVKLIDSQVSISFDELYTKPGENNIVRLTYEQKGFNKLPEILISLNRAQRSSLSFTDEKGFEFPANYNTEKLSEFITYSILPELFDSNTSDWQLAINDSGNLSLNTSGANDTKPLKDEKKIIYTSTETTKVSNQTSSAEGTKTQSDEHSNTGKDEIKFTDKSGTADESGVQLAIKKKGKVQITGTDKLVYRNRKYKINIISNDNIYVKIPREELSNSHKNVGILGKGDVTGTIDNNETYITLISNEKEKEEEKDFRKKFNLESDNQEYTISIKDDHGEVESLDILKCVNDIKILNISRKSEIEEALKMGKNYVIELPKDITENQIEVSFNGNDGIIANSKREIKRRKIYISFTLIKNVDWDIVLDYSGLNGSLLTKYIESIEYDGAELNFVGQDRIVVTVADGIPNVSKSFEVNFSDKGKSSLKYLAAILPNKEIKIIFSPKTENKDIEVMMNDDNYKYALDWFKKDISIQTKAGRKFLNEISTITVIGTENLEDQFEIESSKLLFGSEVAGKIKFEDGHKVKIIITPPLENRQVDFSIPDMKGDYGILSLKNKDYTDYKADLLKNVIIHVIAGREELNRWSIETFESRKLIKGYPYNFECYDRNGYIIPAKIGTEGSLLRADLGLKMEDKGIKFISDKSYNSTYPLPEVRIVSIEEYVWQVVDDYKISNPDKYWITKSGDVNRGSNYVKVTLERLVDEIAIDLNFDKNPDMDVKYQKIDFVNSDYSPAQAITSVKYQISNFAIPQKRHPSDKKGNLKIISKDNWLSWGDIEGVDEIVIDEEDFISNRDLKITIKPVPKYILYAFDFNVSKTSVSGAKIDIIADSLSKKYISNIQADDKSFIYCSNTNTSWENDQFSGEEKYWNMTGSKSQMESQIKDKLYLYISYSYVSAFGSYDKEIINDIFNVVNKPGAVYIKKIIVTVSEDLYHTKWKKINSDLQNKGFDYKFEFLIVDDNGEIKGL